MVSSLVSVITPMYNAEKYIAECMDSVIAQTYRDWEMIVADDCSLDRSAQIVRAYAEKEPRIKLCSLPCNQGAAMARNAALDVAQGRYVAFLDADDWWTPDKLSRQLAFMQENGYGFTFTAYERIYENGAKKSKVVSVPRKVGYQDYLCNTIISCTTVIMDRELIHPVRMEAGAVEDARTWMAYLGKGYTAYGLNENLAIYRITDHSASSNRFKSACRYYACLRDRGLPWWKRLYYQAGYLLHAVWKRLF